MIEVKDGTQLMKCFEVLIGLEEKKSLNAKDLATLMEVNARQMILIWSKEICGNLPQSNEEINGHFRVFRKFLESLLFATATDLYEPDTGRKPKETSYKEMVHVVTCENKKLLDDLKRTDGGITNFTEYGESIKAINEVCLTKWTGFRDTIQPLNPLTEVEGEKSC